MPGAIRSHGSSRIARPQALAAGGGRAGVGVRHQQHELLAAGAHDDVLAAHLAEQQRGDAHQHAVAGLVAEAVVDDLEVVEVEHGEAERAGARGGGVAVDLAREVAPVVQAGEPVAVGLLAQLLLQCLELRGAAARARPAPRRARARRLSSSRFFAASASVWSRAARSPAWRARARAAAPTAPGTRAARPRRCALRTS